MSIKYEILNAAVRARKEMLFTANGFRQFEKMAADIEAVSLQESAELLSIQMALIDTIKRYNDLRLSLDAMISGLQETGDIADSKAVQEKPPATLKNLRHDIDKAKNKVWYIDSKAVCPNCESLAAPFVNLEDVASANFGFSNLKAPGWWTCSNEFCECYFHLNIAGRVTYIHSPSGQSFYAPFAPPGE